MSLPFTFLSFLTFGIAQYIFSRKHRNHLSFRNNCDYRLSAEPVDQTEPCANCTPPPFLELQWSVPICCWYLSLCHFSWHFDMTSKFIYLFFYMGFLQIQLITQCLNDGLWMIVRFVSSSALVSHFTVHSCSMISVSSLGDHDHHNEATEDE